MSTIKPATPTDTYDHTLGSGATTWEWWHAIKPTAGVSVNGAEIADNWQVKITADNGDDGETTVVIGHAALMAAARKIIGGGGGRFVSNACRVACEALIFNADECDFDAATGDELLQVAVLGEVIFG